MNEGPARRAQKRLEELEAARTLAATALETIPVTHTTVDASVMLKYRPVVAYNGPWAQRGDN